MTIKTTEYTCFTVACSQCGAAPEYDDGTIHYPTSDEALNSAVEHCEWTRDGDRLLCTSCAAVEVCARDGHQWGDWRRCLCGGRVPSHLSGRDLRFCKRCSKGEERTAGAPVCESVKLRPHMSRGALLIQHRRNDAILREAFPDQRVSFHVAPEHVEALVDEGAAIAARIDAALLDPSAAEVAS